MHQFHYMTLSGLKTNKGWVSPAELPANLQQIGTLVAPVDVDGNLFDEYIVTFIKENNVGNSSEDKSLFTLQPSGYLKGNIGSAFLKFGPLVRHGKPVIYQYVGNFMHPDFFWMLVELEPVSEEQMDDLYDREKIIIAGCDPLSAYTS